ncbi:MAG: hypothetical protein LBD12_06465 [Clostridiales Family XIII bacterium]|jgi:hypothetical protein|nr:hypothetical protein [Clostridiales Family XIII bacterium]
MLLANFFTDWSLLGNFMGKGIAFFIILGLIGFGIGKLTYHEPMDDEE